MAIIRSKDLIDGSGGIPLPLIVSCIEEHQTTITRLDKLDNYYRGKHAILQRPDSQTGLPNNKLVANHAKFISDAAVGYVLGHPVKYADGQIDDVLAIYKQMDITSHDAEVGKDLSIFGHAVELYYMSGEVPIPKVTCIDPRKLFLVVDDSVEYKPMFGVHYYPRKDIDNREIGWQVNVYSDREISRYSTDSITSQDYTLISQDPHYFGRVPVVEFWNNEEQQGDFEQVLTLIDAYNTLQSDRVNDKEQLVDSILVLKGISLGDDLAESSKTIKLLKELKVLELPSDNQSAEWLTKQLNEQEVELLRKSIKSDIHAFSMVPDLTDENFASNASGVAMKYKLFGLEQLAITKERYFVQGLRERLAMFARIMAIKGRSVDVSNVTISMVRNLPANDLETAQMVAQLNGSVSNETLIGQLSFVDDAATEVGKLQAQKEANVAIQQASFGLPTDPNQVTGNGNAAAV